MPKFHYADFPERGSFGEVGVMEFGLYAARSLRAFFNPRAHPINDYRAKSYQRCPPRYIGVIFKVVMDFGSSKYGIRPFFGNPAKSGSGQISSRICRIWRMSVHLQYVQLITDKTNAADLSGSVLAVLISVTWTIKI